jgi:hypothetical protein
MPAWYSAVRTEDPMIPPPTITTSASLGTAVVDARRTNLRTAKKRKVRWWHRWAGEKTACTCRPQHSHEVGDLSETQDFRGLDHSNSSNCTA